MAAAERVAEWRRELDDAARAAGVAVSRAARGQLLRYLEELLLWRKTVALVSQRTAREIVAKHFEDSFAVARLVRPEWQKAADLGAGAGFPGMVLAILHPHLDVHLVESRRRKASFLRAAVRVTGVENAHVVQERGETLAHSEEFAASCDLVVSRAVWRLPVFFGVALPLLRPGGIAIAMKGPRWAAERGREGESLRLPGFDAVEAMSYRLRRGEQRWLVSARRAPGEAFDRGACFT